METIDVRKKQTAPEDIQIQGSRHINNPKTHPNWGLRYINISQKTLKLHVNNQKTSKLVVKVHMFNSQPKKTLRGVKVHHIKQPFKIGCLVVQAERQRANIEAFPSARDSSPDVASGFSGLPKETKCTLSSKWL